VSARVAGYGVYIEEPKGEEVKWIM